MSDTYKFKNIGHDLNLIKKIVKKEEDILNIDEKIPLGIMIPLTKENTINSSIFKMSYDIDKMIQNNFKLLLLTRKGERLGFSDFGVNIADIYNSINVDNVDEYVLNEIINVSKKYMPYIQITEFAAETLPGDVLNQITKVINIKYIANSSKEFNLKLNVKVSG